MPKVHDRKCEAKGVVMGDPGGHGCRCEIRAIKAVVARTWLRLRAAVDELEDILDQDSTHSGN